jgi:hypothetical protein
LYLNSTILSWEWAVGPGKRRAPRTREIRIGNTRLFARFSRYDVRMTDAEKLADYERMVQIIHDALVLEAHYARQGKSWEEIEFLRSDAYKNIVDATFGPHILRELDDRRNQSRLAKAV